MDAVAIQLANNFQFGSGGKGRRGETFLGKGRGPMQTGQFARQAEHPDDWPCPDCGLKVWARKDSCPQCNQPRAEKPMEVKEQDAPPAGQGQTLQQAVGTEGEARDATKAEDVKKRNQLKHIAKTITNWPEDGKDSDIYRSLQKEAEDLKSALVSAQPTDMQLLGAKEEVNATRRKVLKSERKRDQAVKDVTTAKDEVAASVAAYEAAATRLDKLEQTIKALTEHPKDDPIVTDEEQEVLRKLRAVRAGKAGPVGSSAYQLAMAEIIQGNGSGQGLAEPARGSAAPATPTGKAARQRLRD
eukprot:5273463-Heterocapsa_arctica.AAC.1